MDEDWLILHCLRVKGLASLEALAEMAGLDIAMVEAGLQAALDRGFVSQRHGVLAGWVLSADGRAAHRKALDEEMTVDGRRSGLLERHYGDFVSINADFKQVCTDWQLRDMTTPNPHDDPAYDGAVITRLGIVHERIVPIVEAMATTVPALGTYTDRLDDARVRVEQGDREAFTKPLARSYHDVWMELHEDLLLRLDRRRTDGDA